ncbi:MAG: dihydrodipicolinate synthase family protein, partial [Aristaeellaceae bacterium]
MNHQQYDGLWPVMITPFTADGDIDYASLERLIAWYEGHGAAGLFAACQSSEIFFLSLREREELVRFVKAHAHVPVIASGHVSENVWDQIDELKCMRRAGADALIMITNRLCLPGRAGESFLPRLKMMMEHIDPEVPLGFYECPYPFKRLITLEELRWCAESGRFAFMKDTCCDIALIRDRLRAIEGTPLSLFNANTTTFLDSLRAGAAGFSGVMMNFHMDLYRWLWENWREQPERAEQVQAFLTVFSEIERQYYPVNAKYHLKEIEGVLDSAFARVRPEGGLSETFRDEVRQMHRAARL